MNNKNINNNQLERALKNLEKRLINNIDENNDLRNDILNNLDNKPSKRNYRKKEPKQNFHGAGTIFTNNRVVICGYQRKYTGNKRNFISGFGGSREGNEDYMETAIRETIEEIYDFENKNLPRRMINEIIKSIKPSHIEPIVENKKGKEYIYIMIKYNLRDLQTLMEIVDYYMKKSDNRSNAYEELPRDLEELIFMRRDGGGEIISICVLPVDEVRGKNLIDNGFKNDIDFLYQLAKK